MNFSTQIRDIEIIFFYDAFRLRTLDVKQVLKLFRGLMKKLIFSLMIFSFFGIVSANEKTYISQNAIFFQDNLIWITHENQFIPVVRISADAKGLYIADEDVLGFWECTRCGKVNPPWNFLACDRCGNPK